jgi:plastocyanin
VTARQLRFQPPAIQVPAGTEVTWRFDDGSVPHNVKGDGFASANLARGTFVHRFDRRGGYRYTCTLHAGMDGRVVVTGSG